MISHEYEEIIDGINSGRIKLVRFYVDKYSHYKNCTIKRIEEKFPNGKSFFVIEVNPTKDFSEKVSFLESFEENAKLFKLGRKGRFTLKQLWSQIVILEIVYK